MDLPAATRELAARQGLCTDTDLQDYVARLLPRLEALGLVERV